MNAKDILTYGDRDLHQAFEGLAGDQWEKVGVTTSWTLKDVLAHLLSYEMMLGEALLSVLTPESNTPTIKANQQPGFNDRFVASQADKTPEDLLQAYEAAHHNVQELLSKLSAGQLSATGTIPWYGDGYSLDDYIVYANYGHKREHLAQVKMFRRQQGW